jgi:HEAT repeat protein
MSALHLAARKRLRQCMVVALGAAMVCGLSYFWISSAEPSCQGRSLSEWTEQLRYPQTEGDLKSAEQAIRQLGSNAVPHLLKELRSKDSCARVKMIALLRKHQVLASRFRTAEEKRIRAALAFRALGPAGHQAVQYLALELTNASTFRESANLLFEIGSEALLPLIHHLQTARKEDAMFLSFGIQLIVESDPGGAVPRLVRLTTDRDAGVRRSADAFLRRWAEFVDNDEGDLKVVLPSITPGLRDTNVAVREAFVTFLSRLGSKAHSVIPSLLELTANPDPSVRLAATNALLSIGSRPSPPRLE